MKSLCASLQLLQATRFQPQYGYALMGVAKAELSDLAQHHYLVTLTALLLAREVNSQKGTLNIQRVLEICLFHDLGEIFGGDIAKPYARRNTAAREKARAFEAENQRFLSEYLHADSKYLESLFAEAMHPATDEARIAKIADILEITHYKKVSRRLTEGDTKGTLKVLLEIAQGLEAEIHRKVVTEILEKWGG